MSTIAQALVKLRDSYPRQPFGDRAIRAYGEQLADLPDQLVYEAVETLIRQSVFMPSIAEVRREVVERMLALPTIEQAWDMALAGLLFVPAVRASVNAVGGLWEINHGNHTEMTRRAFMDNYRGRRDTIVREQQGGGSTARPEQLDEMDAEPVSLPARRLREIPESTSIRIRPIALRTAKRRAGFPLAAPSEEERQDAIRVLEEEGDPGDADDPLYVEAFRVFDEAGR